MKGQSPPIGLLVVLLRGAYPLPRSVVERIFESVSGMGNLHFSYSVVRLYSKCPECVPEPSIAQDERVVFIRYHDLLIIISCAPIVMSEDDTPDLVMSFVVVNADKRQRTDVHLLAAAVGLHT